jgi:hypothetical protein
MKLTDITSRTDLSPSERLVAVAVWHLITEDGESALIERSHLAELAGTTVRTVERAWAAIESIFCINTVSNRGLYEARLTDEMSEMTDKLSEIEVRRDVGDDRQIVGDDRHLVGAKSDKSSEMTDKSSEVGAPTPLHRKPKGFHYSREDSNTSNNNSKDDPWDRMPMVVQECFHRFEIPISVGSPVAIAMKCKAADLSPLEVEQYITDGLAGMTTDGKFSAANMVSAFLNPNNVRKWRSKQQDPGQPEHDLKCTVRNEWTEGVLI